MKTYTTPKLTDLGKMSEVTRKSGPAYDLEIFAYAQPEGFDPCDQYPFQWCP